MSIRIIASSRRRLRGPGSLLGALALLTVTVVVGPAAVRAAQAGDQGVATTVTVTLTPDTIPADHDSITSSSGSDSTVVVTVADADGNAVTDEKVTLSTDGDVTFGFWEYGYSFRPESSAASNGDGTYSLTVRASSTPGPNAITATATEAGVSATATLVETPPGPQGFNYSYTYAEESTVVLDPGREAMPADGKSKFSWYLYFSTVPIFSLGLPNTAVRFSSPGGDLGFTDARPDPAEPGPQQYCQSIGSYCQITVVASETAGAESPRATLDLPEGTPAGIAPATRSLRVVETEVVDLKIVPAGPLVADGVSRKTALVTIVRDARGREPVIDETVLFSAFEAGSNNDKAADITFGEVTNHLDGTYSADITASTTAGAVTVTATARRQGVSATTTLTEVPGAPGDEVVLALDPPVMQADGVSRLQGYFAPTDAGGNPIREESVAFSSDGGLTFGEVTEGVSRDCRYCRDRGNGIYTVEITTTNKVGPVTVTAVASPSQAKGSVVLLQMAAPAQNVSVSLERATLPADGVSTTVVTARVTDASGNPVPIENVVFVTSGTSTIGPVNDHADGTYSATVTVSSTPGTESITATARKSGKVGSTVLTLARG